LWAARLRAQAILVEPDAALDGVVNYGRTMKAAVSRDDPAYAGQAVYSPLFLRFYDLFVLGFNGNVAWRCSPRVLVRMYDEHVSAHHLDIGVGSGYYLDKCRHPTPSPDITLMDLNPNSLAAAARRIQRYEPKTHQGNALEPFGLDAGTFDSIGMNWLLHCLPGDIATKSAVFDHCSTVLAPGGAIFGSTVLNRGVRHNAFSRWMMNLLNRRGAFTNLDDDLEGLKTELGRRFSSVEVKVVGSVAIFAARV
jgi:ubiquinone/menaquinone biosynthesis C-methylase UbiE